MPPKRGSVLKFSMKTDTNMISVAFIATIQIQPWDFDSPIPKATTVCHILSLHVRFIIFHPSHLSISILPLAYL